MKKVITSTNAPAPIGPYSQAILVNGMLFASGQIAIDPSTGVYDPADAATETRLVMSNIKAILDASGLDFSNVVKTSIFLKDMNDFAVVNEVYASYFTENFPARETVQVSVLPKNARVEISIIAAV
jgi:2-iminobutanoate/2-iminopropanoate deaminase